MTAFQFFMLLTMASLTWRGEGAEAAAQSGYGPACLAKLRPEDRQMERPISRGLRLISRGTPSLDSFYLTSNRDQPDDCGARGERTIYAKLLVPSAATEWVGVSFDCTSADRTVRRGDPLIGVFDKQHPAYGKARRAWTISHSRRGFAPVERTECQSFDQ